MDVQHAALSKMIVEGQLRLFVDARITTEFFPDEKWRKVFVYLTDHWRQYGTPPTVEVVARSYPTYKWVTDDPQPAEYYIDQLRDRRKGSIFMEALQHAGSLLADDEEPDQNDMIMRVLHEALVQAKTETSATRDTNLVAAFRGVLARIGLRRSSPGHLRGLTTGFDGIDYVTGGLQPEQFIVLTGIPKSGKSSFLLYMALQVFLSGKVPLFVGFEMSNDEQEDRLTSLMSGISLTSLLNGTTTMQQWGKVNKAWKDLEGMHPLILSADRESATTVSGLQSKVMDLQPDALFVDGAYLMESDRLDPKVYPKGSPQVLTDISRSMKQLAQSARIPIVVTTQSLVARSRGGLTLGSIGYTSAFGQDADLILGVERQENSNISKLHVIDSRSGPRKDCFIEWDWDRGYVGELDAAQFTPAARAAATNGKFEDAT